MANTNLWNCLNLYNTFNIKVMSAKAKFNHNLKKAKRQREIDNDIQADNLRHMENMIAVRKMIIRHEYKRDLLEQKFLKSFNTLNTTNLKEHE